MRVSPDGTFHGLRPSHGCQTACWVSADPGALERRHVALHPVIDYRPYISASPDVFPPGHSGYDQGVAADLQIPTKLRDQIDEWVDQFKNHFLHLGDRPVDQPEWSVVSRPILRALGAAVLAGLVLFAAPSRWSHVSL